MIQPDSCGTFGLFLYYYLHSLAVRAEGPNEMYGHFFSHLPCDPSPNLLALHKQLQRCQQIYSATALLSSCRYNLVADAESGEEGEGMLRALMYVGPYGNFHCGRLP